MTQDASAPTQAQASAPAPFNPNEHLITLKGKAYLEAKWRIVWFRSCFPHGVIDTKLVELDLERGIAVFAATVYDGVGGQATGHGSETSRDFGDYIEKAETKAIARALAALGYGTQFAVELDELPRIADAPVVRRNGNGGEPADAQLIERIKKLYRVLNRQEPPGLDQFTEAQAKAMHAKLMQVYEARKKAQAQAQDN